MLRTTPAGEGSALDIGGTRARIYAFKKGQVVESSEIRLPARLPQEEDAAWGERRVLAIAEMVSHWAGPLSRGRLPTACAGRKDEARESVILSFYGSPLPGLVRTVRKHTGVDCGPLFDDDVCAGWGHLASPRGGLQADSPNSMLLTAGTGLAECLWVEGDFLLKGTYPRLAELGVEDFLRAEGWRNGDLPLEPLRELLQARSGLAQFERLVLSGRFAGVEGWPARLESVEVVVAPLEEAPALGALTLSQRA